MKIALYARVSTEKQEDEKTIDSQLADLEKYAKARLKRPNLQFEELLDIRDLLTELNQKLK